MTRTDAQEPALFPQRSINRCLVLLVALVVGAHVAVQTIRFATGHDHLKGLTPLFDMDKEANVPTWAATGLLLLAAALLTVIARLERHAGGRHARHWFVLAVIFLLMSLDEAAGLHERLSPVLREITGSAGGFLHYAWVLPAAVLVFVVGIGFLGFLRALPPATRRSFTGAGMLFVAGALGIEVFEGRHAAHHGFDNVGYQVHVTIEETLEFAGSAWFVGALCAYLRTRSSLRAI